MNLLLTGATGFVGRNFLLSALNANCYTTIYAPVRSKKKLIKQFEQEEIAFPNNLKVIETKAPQWELGSIDVDHAVHCAGTLFGNTKKEYFDINVDGTINLIQQLPEKTKILILSSQAAGGPCAPGKESRSESDIEQPISLYGESKLAMEQVVKERFVSRQIMFLRPPMILGPRDTATLPLFQMASKPIRFKPGFDNKYYSYIEVSDLVKAIHTMLGSKVPWSEVSSKVFFICNDNPISDRELIQTAAKVQGNNKGLILKIPIIGILAISRVLHALPPLRGIVPSLGIDRVKDLKPTRWVNSVSLFESIFGWKPTTELKSALEATRLWYQKTGDLK